MRKLLGSVVSLAFVLTLAGCLERELSPLNPCLSASVKDRVGGHGISKVDLLFMVDNSLSMVEEQAKLREQFPKLIHTLTTGTRADGATFSPVQDLHVAVITSDMGTPGEPNAGGCATELGDDGVFVHASNPSADPTLIGCKPSYPTFLEFHGNVDDPDTFANDFACIATVGSGGCGYEQQLEAPLKALWPRTLSDAQGQVIPQDLTFLGTQAAGPTSTTFGHGDSENTGFLRNDPNDPSLLAIVLVTDEDDCSATTSVQFRNDFSPRHPNLRCHDNPQNLKPISRYVEHFEKLRPGHEDLVLFAAITGVPTTLVDQAASVDFTNGTMRDAYYDRVLADPAMQETPVDLSGDGEPDHLTEACRAQNGGEAYPARRIVEVAKGMGAQATVQSICAESFEPAMNAIIRLISDRLPGVCLAHPLVRSSDGLVKCEVVWELPKLGSVATAPHDCSERPYLSPPAANHAQVTADGGKICRIRQLPVHDKTLSAAAGEQGWYYDDFSDDTLKTCGKRGTPQRVSFTDGAEPPFGVTVSLECFDEAQRYVSNRTDVRLDERQPEIGDSCEAIRAPATSHDEMCWVTLADPLGGAQHDGIDRNMFCHPKRNICVRACGNRTDCPPAWVCDDRHGTFAATMSEARPDGSAICANPTCAADADDAP